MLDDLRYALRALRARPALTLVTILTLTIGLGANLSMFGILNALLFRPMPGIENEARLVAVQGIEEGAAGVASWKDMLDYRSESRAFNGLAALKTIRMDVSFGESAERVEGSLVSEDYFEVLGVKPALGRFFVPTEHRVPNAVPVAVLTWETWRMRFGADPGVLSKDVRINARPFRIIGVAPRGFRGPALNDRPAVFVPFVMLPHFYRDGLRLLESRGWGGIRIAGRLAAGQTVRSAQSGLDIIASRLAREYPKTNAGRGVRVVPLADALLPPDMRAKVVRIGGISMVVLGLLLVLVCANVALLTLVRAASRTREIAIRKALGSATSRLVRQLMIESALVGVLGAGGGLLLAQWTAALVNRLQAAASLNVGIDLRVVAFAAGLMLVSLVLFGLAPAVLTARTDFQVFLRSGPGRGSARNGIGFALVVIQVALSASLLFVSGLLMRSVMKLEAEGPGFDPSGVVVASVDPGLQGRTNPTQIQAYYDELMDRLRARPEIQAVGASSILPLSGDRDANTFRREGDDETKRGRLVSTQVIREGYFEALRMSILRGRSIRAADGPGSPLVVVINESLARSFWPGQDPIGKRMRPDPEVPWATVVGVVRDSSLEEVRTKDLPWVFVSQRQLPAGGMGSQMTLLVRGRRGMADPSAALAATIRSVDSQVPIVGLAPLESHIAESLMPERILRTMIFGTGVAASFLAMLALYAILAFLVTQRRRELGIRMAIGASAAGIQRLVVSRALVLVVPALILGIAAGAFLGRLVQPFLYRVQPADTATALLVTGAILTLALGASWIPARRAASIDPAEALRAE